VADLGRRSLHCSLHGAWPLHTALGVSLQLYVGLANIPSPYEWEWSYGAIIIIAILLFGIAPGRILGIDGILRKRWASSGGFTRFLRALT
jgi:hypothetical protein